MRLANPLGCRRGRDRLCGLDCPPDVCVYARAVQNEMIAPHKWEARTSPDGVPIQVARLRKAALVRG